MANTRLDEALVSRGLCHSRSQAENFIKLGKVRVDGRIITKPGYSVRQNADISLEGELYVSRAGLKLASAMSNFGLRFENKTVLDVGSSTGGFTDYALQHGAAKVIAVDVGTDQLHATLRKDERVELHEQTDIRDFKTNYKPDIIVIDVSFISLRQILPSIIKLADPQTHIIAMCKPQFEVGDSVKHKGVIKNDQMRRTILKDFETWTKQFFVVESKADSNVLGTKGNRERFYLLKAAAAAK